MSCIPQVPGNIYGTGEEANWYDGVAQPANFFGQPGWWNPPTNWFTWTDDQGQIWVSPNPKLDPVIPSPFAGTAVVNMVAGPPVINVTVTTTTAHGLNVGDVVVISGSTFTPFNGSYFVNNVLTDTAFTYQVVNLHSGVHSSAVSGQGPAIVQPDPSPKYACKINLDGAYVFQDLMRNLISGNANPFLFTR